MENTKSMRYKFKREMGKFKYYAGGQYSQRPNPKLTCKIPLPSSRKFRVSAIPGRKAGVGSFAICKNVNQA